MFDIGKRGSTSQADEQDQDMDTLMNTMPGGSPSTGEHAGSDVRRRDAAVVGPSIHIEGTLRGEEDLIIEGRVKGTVQLQGHKLTIGNKGQVEAELHAQSIYVDGTVQGDLHGTELVSVRKSARIHGNITAPRVNLEDGAKFKGAIDMDVESPRPASSGADSAAKQSSDAKGAPASSSAAASAASSAGATPGGATGGSTNKGTGASTGSSDKSATKGGAAG